MSSFIRASDAAFAACLAACLLFRPSPAADVVITSEQKGAEVIALGLVQFPCLRGNPQSIPYTPWALLAGDLDFSGRFRVRTSPRFDKVTQAYFDQDGALAYLRGDYALDGDRYVFDGELVDLASGEVILKKKYAGPRDELRTAVHQFADELTYQLFGEKGVAQTRIAYVNRRFGNKEIRVMDYDGSDSREVTRNGSINLGPIFLEDKGQLLFTSYSAGTPQFYRADLDKAAVERAFRSPGMSSAPSYNRLDREIAYASTMDGNSEIYRRPAEGGKPVRLTFSWSIDTSPSWSPNGYEIVFVSDRSGKPMLYVMDRDGSNLRRITYDFGYCGSPAWSPKGDRIAFTAMDDGNNFNIYTTAPDGTSPVRLTSGGSNESPTWSPDGRFIAFMSTRLGSPEIFVMRADGGEIHRLTFSGGNSMPSWSDY